MLLGVFNDQEARPGGNRVTAVRTPVYPGVVADCCAACYRFPWLQSGVWFYISRTNPVMGALNKAILTAELAPIVGDIKFPEGVLLGAAMESTEDLLNLLEVTVSGVLRTGSTAQKKKRRTSGEIVAGQIVKFVAPHESCKNSARKGGDIEAGIKGC